MLVTSTLNHHPRPRASLSPLPLLFFCSTILLLTFLVVESSGPICGFQSPLLMVSAEKIADCCCEHEMVDLGNDQSVYETLLKLRVSPHTEDLLTEITTFLFFRIFKVNLYDDCPFWRENPQCSRINCAVCGECRNEDLPEPWRIPTTDPVDRTLMGGFKGWQERDDSLWIVQDGSSHMSYINMQLNPEGYTGYEGFAPHRIWSAIYEENCFLLGKDAAQSKPKELLFEDAANIKEDGQKPSSAVHKDRILKPHNGAEVQAMCYEQRVLYRLLSGMHTSISCHIANSYPIGVYNASESLYAPSVTAMKQTCGPNVTQYQQRVMAFPERKNNMYFAFVFMLRAINKAQATLKSFNYTTGNAVEDAELTTVMNTFLDSNLVNSCSSQASFDETMMFSSASGRSLKNQLKGAFRNISRIMDCVGCEKCKLHGKLQILGLGTALKILFNEGPSLKLERNEVMALIVTTAKLSHSLKVAHEMEKTIRELEQAKSVAEGDLPEVEVVGPITLAWFIVIISTIVYLMSEILMVTQAIRSL